MKFPVRTFTPIDAPAVRYPRAMIVMHWLIAGMVALQLIVALLFALLRNMPTTLMVMNLHRSIGLTIFVLMAARLMMRLARPLPAIQDGIPAWQKLTAKTVHAAFYLVLFAAPAVGWFYTNAVGQEVTFFWLLHLPTLVDANSALAERLLTAHIALALALVFLVGLHSCGALYNHRSRR